MSIRDDIVVKFPPEEGELGKLLPVICTNPKCGLSCDVWVSRSCDLGDGVVAKKCPEKGCKGKMVWNISGMSVAATCSGPGVSSTKYGQRRSRELTARNETLKKKQWDNHEVMKSPEGATPRNPTEGGPMDPKGPFAKKPKAKTTFLPKGK